MNLFILAAAAVAMAASGSYFFIKKDACGRRVLFFKAFATAMPVLLSVWAGVHDSRMQIWLLAAAGFCCMAADVFLETAFTWGVFLFAAGHLLYLSSYIRLAQPDLITWLLVILLYAGMIFLHRKHIPNLGELKIPAFLYCALLSTMTAMSVTVLLRTRSIQGALIAAGGVCFFMSDNILAGNLFGDKTGRFREGLLLALYYAAVYLIAASSYAPAYSFG